MSIKALLSPEVKAFLKRHDIPLAAVFNATDMKRAGYGPAMKAGGHLVAVGVSTCQNGHALRTRHGKCVICSPATLSFSRRYEAPGEVYLAYSEMGSLYKVGITNNIANRVEQLNAQGTGGYYDWVLLAIRLCAAAGEVENHAHTLLSPYAVREPHAGRQGSSREIFRCSDDVALDAYRRATVDDHPKASKRARVASLPLTERTREMLIDGGVRTLSDLLDLTEAEFQFHRYLSGNAKREIAAYLKMEGRSFRKVLPVTEVQPSAPK